MVRAFILGVREFRLGVTSSYFEVELQDAYDMGREFAQRFTFWRWDIAG